MEINDLIDIGLTKNQAKVYLKLIKEPGQSGGQIAKGMSMDRSFVYNVIASLADKGLISYIFKENVKVFYPANPESLLKDSEEKTQRIMSVVAELKKIKADVKATKEEKTILVYNGKPGLKVFMRDLLDSNSFLSFDGGGLHNLFDVLKYEFPLYLKEFKKKNVKGKIITSPENKINMKKTYASLNIKIKAVEELNKSLCFVLFNNKLAIYSLEEKPYVIIIEDKSVADTLTVYFNSMWDALK